MRVRYARHAGCSTLLFLGLLGFAGCGPSGDLSSEPAPLEPTAAPGPPVEPAVSINAVMVALVDHASHQIWDAGREGAAPQSDADWLEIDHHAIQIAAAGSWIAQGGNGEADPGWVRLPNWAVYAQELTDAAVAARAAAEAHDLEALLQAGDQLVETCESCHAEFKPDLPSEGIVHPH